MKEQDIEMLKKIIDAIYNIYKQTDGWEFDVENEDLNGKTVESIMDNYEEKDMNDFLKRYPYMKLLSYDVVYYLQKFYNGDYLCAGWCGCATPKEIIEKYGDKSEK